MKRYTLKEKVEILANSAKYDVSCSSSGSRRPAAKGQLGNGHVSGICHSWSADGRCISLLKILLSNDCIYDCQYCINRKSANQTRVSLDARQLAALTIAFYRRNYIEGLFLSSAVWQSPDYTMEQMIDVVRLLRDDYNFNGYIHMKAIPAASRELIEKAGRLVDRMSINAELATAQSLQLMAPQKSVSQIIEPIQYIRNRIIEQKSLHSSLSFVPAGQTTQVIVGATADSDRDILNLAQTMYRQNQMKRVYYSAYVPADNQAVINQLHDIPTTREHRLYQADWLLRFYGFSAEELLDEQLPNFDLSIDPKAHWALCHLNQFPIEVNAAGYHQLLRIPGIGPKSARRIIDARCFGRLSIDDLKRIGVVLKRAIYFITVAGRYYGKIEFSPTTVKRALLISGPQAQLSLLDMMT